MPPKVPNIIFKFNFNVRFLALIHRGHDKYQKANAKMDKLDSFVMDETNTILT